MSNFLKATAVRDTVLTALSRMLTMAPTVWRNAGGSFRGVAGDTITVRIPAYTSADKRTMRTGTTRTRRGLFEAAVPVALDTNLYRDVVLTDEHQTLDIMNFSRQVLNPMLEGIARGIEDELIDTASAATYQHSVTVSSDNPTGAIVQARKHLQDSRVPDDGNRFLALGSAVEAAFLDADLMKQVNTSGTGQTLRRGVLGDLYGFTVVSVPGLPPEKAYAYHRTAYALSLQAPIVPTSFTGFTAVQDGFAIRLVQVPDPSTIENVVAADVFTGSSAVLDTGTINEDGQFIPDETPDASGATELFVRAVELDLEGDSA